MAILSAFDPQHPDLGVNEMARRLELSRSAVSRLLASLEASGYVTQDARTGRFRLGRRALELSYTYFQTNELVTRAAPYLVDVGRALEMHTHLYGLEDGRLFRYLMIHYPSGVGMLAGFHGLAHATAGGKVLLASLPQAEVPAAIERWGLPALTQHTITDPQRLLAHLDDVRRQGYALDDEESGVGKRCIAVPVRDASSQVVAAASVSTQRHRLPDERVPLVRDQLVEAAMNIAIALGYGPASGLRPANGRPSRAGTRRVGNGNDGKEERGGRQW